MKHTPGPWYESNTGNHQGLIISENTGENIAVSYDKANAALIAAAPDLLDEYQWLHERVVTMAQAMRNKGLGNWVNAWLSDGVLDGKAITKATDI